MTAPYWGDDADWAGLLLFIVPVAPLPLPVGELAQLVRDRIESDAALYDVVTVAHGPSPAGFTARSEWHRALLVSMIRAAMPDGHFFAPSGIFATIAVGEFDEDIQKALDRLDQDEPLNRFLSFRYGGRIRRDPQRGGIAQRSVRSIARAGSKIMAAYEQSPGVAVGERHFHAEVDQLVLDGLIAREELAVAPPRAQPVAPPRPQPMAPSRPQPVAPPTPQPAPRVRATPPATRPDPAPTPPHTPGLPAAPDRQPQAPVFHQGDDVVLVDSRSALSRLRRPAPTDADAIERLAMSTDAVSLAYFVIVPDAESSARKTGREHRTQAVNLDRLLATVGGDVLTGRRMRVAVEVVAALNPLRKHGVLRPAGDLTEGDVPKVPSELFDHAKTVEGLLSAAERSAVAFQARGVDVLSLHYIFLSSVALRDANTFGADWNPLLEHARVTWIEIGHSGPTDNPEPADVPPSPYGFHLVSDRYDVAALVREESATLYRYRSPAPPEPVTPEAPPADATTPGDETAAESPGRRRWLSRRRRHAD